MKNLIIGFMLGVWCGPVLQIMSRRLVLKMHQKLDERLSEQKAQETS